MENYLGETLVLQEDTPFAKYTPTDWAMYFISRYGQIDGGHKKAWVLDQVARILKGTPVEIKLAQWGIPEVTHKEYRISTVRPPSPEYLEWVQDMQKGDGEEFVYVYEEGKAP